MTEKPEAAGLGRVWQKVFSLVKRITGDVEVDTKGDLQTQINNLSAKVDNSDIKESLDAINIKLDLLSADLRNRKTVINPDGSITEIYDNGTKTTVKNEDGSITQTFTPKNGEQVTHKTTFSENGVNEEFTEEIL